MYKTKVQELCQRRLWSLPDYKTIRDGPDHNPRFACTVTVNGLPFQTPSPTRTAKEAQNNAAKLAFDHFSQPNNPNPNPTLNPPLPLPPQLTSLPGCSQPNNPNPNPNLNHPIPLLPQLPSLPGCSFPQPSLSEVELSSLPHPPLSATSIPSSGSSGPSSGAGSMVLQPKLEEGCQASQISSPVTSTVTAGDQKNVLHLYKNQLQNYAQKKNLNLPVYSSEWDGPPHALRFKCKVTIDGQTFESPKFFSTLKDAEHAAAEVALMSLSPSAGQEDNIVLYKNLLQELVQKEGLRLPSYNTNKYGEAHAPIFVSQVELEGELFTGQEAKSKKQAEMSAAKVAYMTLKERKGKSDQSSLIPLSAHQGHAPEFSSDRSEANVITGLQNHGNPKSPISHGLITQNQPDKDKEPVIFAERNTNCCKENSSLSNVQSAPLNVHSAPALAESTNVASGTASCRRKVAVYSRNTNVKIEEGGTLMPISDDKWVAYSYSH